MSNDDRYIAAGIFLLVAGFILLGFYMSWASHVEQMATIEARAHRDAK